jgi:microcystin-dependent protein
MEGYMSAIMPWAMNFEPRNWMFCRGQILQISQNSALFSLLGTTYGGDGRATFALPNLQGRIALGAGQGVGLDPLRLGQTGGADTVTLTAANLPAHTHALNANGSPAGNVPTPAGSVLSNTQAADRDYLAAGTVTPLAANAVGMTGSSQPVSVVQPYVAMHYIICVQGIYPPRP